VAAGLSARGLRFKRRYGERVTYIEGDLPGMVHRKRQALGQLQDGHRIEKLDALSDESLAAIVATLDPGKGLAFVTEGLLGYLERDQVTGIWRRFARTLAGFRDGIYVSDMHIGELQNAQVRAFRVLLSLFVRGRVHLHFGTEKEVITALHEAGFASAEVWKAAEVVGETRDEAARLAHIIEASIR
jgi:O-methyltransferase involved in polyketide biosynthesis